MVDQFIPISLKVPEQKRALVVGGGNVAYDKIKWLRSFNIGVDVISSSLSESLKVLCEHELIHWIEASYLSSRVKDYALVIAATDDEQTNRQIYEDAQRDKVPVNVVDQPELCTFFVPSTVRRGPLTVSISSGGNSPSLCARLRRDISEMLPQQYSEYVTLLGQVRRNVKQCILNRDERRALLAALASRETEQDIFAKNIRQWPEELNERVSSFQSNGSVSRGMGPGVVWLVGAGPGDPGLLTIKGRRCIERADVIVHDGLVNPVLLEYGDPHGIVIDASKRVGCKRYSQEEINQLLAEYSQRGQNVCRLKGGDPLVFGRGAEEAQFLRARNIPFEFVPGVSSATGALAYAGIPVTHRDHASYFQVVTGHESPEKTVGRVNWKDIGSSRGTVVFLMGAHRLSEISGLLISNGKDDATPVAVICRGTLADQYVFETTLRLAADKHYEETMDFPRPALIVVGSVVTLKEQLEWFAVS